MEKHILQWLRAADSQCGVLLANVGNRYSAMTCPGLVDRPVRFVTRQISTSGHFLSWSVRLLAVLINLCGTPNAGATLFSAGEAVDLGNSANAAGNYLYFFPATVAKSGQLLRLGIIVRAVSSPLSRCAWDIRE